MSKIIKTPDDKKTNPRLTPINSIPFFNNKFEPIALLDYFTPPTIETIKQIRLDKDGTYYDLLMILVNDGIYCGSMCNNGKNWIIINNINRTAYSFNQNGYLALDYLTEKIGEGLSKTDMKNIQYAINYVRKEYNNHREVTQ